MEIAFHVNEQFLSEEPDAQLYLQAVQLMLNRMAVSHFKYGLMRNKYPESAHAIDSADKRSAMYRQDGNTENCLDTANFAIIEYVRPSHPRPFFSAQDSTASPGIVWQED